MSGEPTLSAKTISGLARFGRGIWHMTIGRHWLVVLVLLLVLGAFLGLRLDVFFSLHNLLNVARTFSLIAIVAIGESLVIIIGGIDLSVGAVMALAGLISALCMRCGAPVPLAIVAGLSTGGLIGWLNGTIISRVKLPPFIVTLATMSIARGITHGLSGGWSVTDLPEGFRVLGQQNLSLGPIPIPLPVLFMTGLAALIGLLMGQTSLGRYAYTLADNEQALLVSGVRVAQVKTSVYVLCGLLAAVGGLLMTARLSVAAPSAAEGYELDIIAAAVIGGTSLFGGQGSIPGILVGAAVIQMLRNGLVLLGFSAYWQMAALGTMILLFILLDYWRRQKLVKGT
jgi:ribose transport system permease protein